MKTRLFSLGVAAFALVAVISACGGDDSVGAPDSSTTTSTATTSTTAAPDCTLEGGTDQTIEGEPALEAGAPAALLRYVQVEASDCADAVVYSFFRGTPGYTVSYTEGPFTADPSGKPVDVAGTTFLAVRLFPASGVDLTSPNATQIYAGEPVLEPVPPSDLAVVRQLGDFESVDTWVIGLDDRRPFTVDRTPSSLVITIEASAPRAPRCATEGVDVTYPATWFASVASTDACQRFDPAPFIVQPQTDSLTWAVAVEASTSSYDDAVERWSSGTTATVVSTRDETIDGHRAVAIETESNGTGLAPAGWRSYAHVVDRAPRGSVAVVVGATAPGSTYDARRRGADEIAAELHV